MISLPAGIPMEVQTQVRTAVFFDLGDTLEVEALSHRHRADAVSAICARHGKALSADRFLDLQMQAAAEGALSAYAKALSELRLPAPALQEIKKTVKWDQSQLFLNPDALVLLPTLKKKYRLGIIANQSEPIAPRLKQYGIAGYFDDLLCSCELGFGKPDPRIFERAEEAAKGDCDSFWMIGDRVDNDIVPARKRGWKTVRFMTGLYRGYPCDRDEEKADHEISCLIELSKIL